MGLLIAGVVLWVVAHVFKRIAPEARANMGDKGKGAVAIALFVSLGLMIWGYRAAEFVPVYDPMPGMKHLNNLLMVIAVYLYGVGGTKGTIYPLMRHPMLWGTVLWAAAHLLVNGDQASLILFGGLGLWALVQMSLINRAGPWVSLPGRGIKGDAMNLAGTVVLVGVMAWVHHLLGYNVFGG